MSLVVEPSTPARAKQRRAARRMARDVSAPGLLRQRFGGKSRSVVMYVSINLLQAGVKLFSGNNPEAPQVPSGRSSDSGGRAGNAGPESVERGTRKTCQW